MSPQISDQILAKSGRWAGVVGAASGYAGVYKATSLIGCIPGHGPVAAVTSSARALGSDMALQTCCWAGPNVGGLVQRIAWLCAALVSVDLSP